MLGWEFPPHISGGLGTACAGLVQGLSRAGVEVLFVVPRRHGDEDQRHARVIGCNDLALDVAVAPDDEATAIVRRLAIDSSLSPYLRARDYDAAAAPANFRSVGVARASRGSRGELSGSYGPDLFGEVERYAAVVAELAARERFDVVHAHDWMTYPAGIAAARRANVPLVIHVHACEYDRSGEHVDLRIRDLEQLGLDAAQRVVAVSYYTANVLRQRYRIDTDSAGDKLRVVHNAVTHKEQLESFRVEKLIDEPIVLFLGRITFQKGPDYFLEAARRVVDALPAVKFVMVGDGDMWPRMVERAARLGLARHVHFTGFLSGADVERIYAMADVYVMPSVSEPFGISPLEAMALDVPVIVSRQSGVAEVLTNALKVDFWDVEEIANKIVALLRYPALREHLTAQGREEVRAMRWEARGQRLRDVYAELVR